MFVTHSTGEITLVLTYRALYLFMNNFRCLSLKNLEILWTAKLPFEMWIKEFSIFSIANRKPSAHFSFVHDRNLFFTTRDESVVEVSLAQDMTLSLANIRLVSQLSNVRNGVTMTADGQLIYIDQSKNAVMRICLNRARSQPLEFISSAWILSYSVGSRYN